MGQIERKTNKNDNKKQCTGLRPMMRRLFCLNYDDQRSQQGQVGVFYTKKNSIFKHFLTKKHLNILETQYTYLCLQII